MTLYRQLVLIITALCVLMFAGTVAVNLYSTQKYLLDQLQSHAEDTASSLGLSLSPHMASNDFPMMNSMIDAIYDRGYYSVVRLVTLDGEVLIERQADKTLEGIPDWFIDLVPLKTPEAGAQVMSGWNLAAVIYVQSHPGYAYRQLWRSSTRMLFWFVAVAFGIGIAGAIGIHALLKPLRKVEKQAEGICAREYEVQDPLPRTRELRRVVRAMNRMTLEVKEMFGKQAATAERMQELAYQDTLTGLGNRRYFDSRLNAVLGASEEMHKGALMLIQIVGLQEINDQLGFAAGDALITAAADGIRDVSAGLETIIGRRSGADFALLLPGIDETGATELAARLAARLAQLHSQELSGSENVFHIGITSYVGDKPGGELLAEADEALRMAQAHGSNRWHVYQSGDQQVPAPGRQEWGKRLADSIDRRDVVLHVQPVMATTVPQRLLHREVLVRISAPDGRLWNAGTFMPIAEELNLARSIDRIVIELLLEHLRITGGSESYAINLSPGSLHDQVFLDWVITTLDKLPAGHARLLFELSEFSAVQDLEHLREFAARVRAAGHGLGLDHFGQSFSAFGYLQSLRPDYVKLDGAYTVQIDSDRDNRFFVQTLCGIAHSLDILMIAEMVETETQLGILKDLKLDGVQGYAVGRPADIG